LHSPSSPLHPFPTRRSSDLTCHPPLRATLGVEGTLLHCNIHYQYIILPLSWSVNPPIGCTIGALITAPIRWYSVCVCTLQQPFLDRKSTRLNSSHVSISYAV